MYSIRRWFYRPKREDSSKLAQFYWADEELNMIAAELDSFDGRKDPERCSALVNQLRQSQDKVLTICSEIMDEAIPDSRANRDFQAKFPDDVLQENLSGQLWFGAECLAAGSNILNRESESTHMRPLAKALTRALDNVRFLLREQCLRNPAEYTDKVKEALWIFDRLFADFELCYVGAMVPVKTAAEFHLQQEVIVLFSETLQRAIALQLVQQDLVDYCDPSLMFTIPRLAIVCGLLIFPDGPLRVDDSPEDMSELFRPFFSLLLKIRDLLWTLSLDELLILEKTLCSLEDPELVLAQLKTGICSPPSSSSLMKAPPTLTPVFFPLLSSKLNNSKQFIRDFYQFNFGPAPDYEEEKTTPVKTTRVRIRKQGNSQSTSQSLPTQGPLTTKRSKRSSSSRRNSSLALVPIATNSNSPVLVRVSQLRDEQQTDCDTKSGRSSTFSSCSSLNSSLEWDGCSSETSSNRSECQDDQEIALALQAAEIATCNKARARFKDSTDLIHRLFVCISGVADQLQTNFASDLRNILKCVFELNSSPRPVSADQEEEEESGSVPSTPKQLHPSNHNEQLDAAFRHTFLQEQISDAEFSHHMRRNNGWSPDSTLLTPPGGGPDVDYAEEAVNNQDNTSNEESQDPNIATTFESAPNWLPDKLADACMACKTQFTLLRRRHHCRNCGKIFCSRCSSESIPLPRFGHVKAVRVCTACFVSHVAQLLTQQCNTLQT